MGGPQGSDQAAITGSGIDTIYQFGGQGVTRQYAEGGLGNQTIIQVGGQANSDMEIKGDVGTTHIEQYGGQGNNIMTLSGATNDDVIAMYGGLGNNTMIYNVSGGNDLVTILGGGVIALLLLTSWDRTLLYGIIKAICCSRPAPAAAPLPWPTSNGLRSSAMMAKPSTPLILVVFLLRLWRRCC